MQYVQGLEKTDAVDDDGNADGAMQHMGDKDDTYNPLTQVESPEKSRAKTYDSTGLVSMKVSYEGESSSSSSSLAPLSSSSSSSSSNSVTSKVHRRQLAGLDDSGVVNLAVSDSMGPDTPSHPGMYADEKKKKSKDEVYRDV